MPTGGFPPFKFKSEKPVSKNVLETRGIAVPVNISIGDIINKSKKSVPFLNIDDDDLTESEYNFERIIFDETKYKKK